MAECESVKARSTAASSQDELGGRRFHARLQAGSRQYNISYLKGLLLFPVTTLTGRRVRFSRYVECRTSASWPSLAKECKGAPWSASPRAHLSQHRRFGYALMFATPTSSAIWIYRKVLESQRNLATKKPTLDRCSATGAAKKACMGSHRQPSGRIPVQPGTTSSGAAREL